MIYLCVCSCSYYTRALTIQEGQAAGTASLDMARTLNSLGNCYQAMTRYEDARTAYLRALAVQVCAHLFYQTVC